MGARCWYAPRRGIKKDASAYHISLKLGTPTSFFSSTQCRASSKKNSHVLYHITRAVRHNVALHHLLTPHYQPLPNLAVWTKQRLTLLSKNRWLVLFIEVKKGHFFVCFVCFRQSLSFKTLSIILCIIECQIDFQRCPIHFILEDVPI